MGRPLSLQDDTFLEEMSWFRYTDKAGLSYWFLEHAILDVLERGLDLDLSAFRHVADDREGVILDRELPADTERRQLLALRQDMDRAWQSPAVLAAAIEQVLARIDTPQGFPPELITAIQALSPQTTIYPEYYHNGELAQELQDLRRMVQHAVRRGATRVRLLER